MRRWRKFEAKDAQSSKAMAGSDGQVNIVSVVQHCCCVVAMASCLDDLHIVIKTKKNVDLNQS